MHWNCEILENAQRNNNKNILKILHFQIYRKSSAFLVLDYEKVVFRSFKFWFYWCANKNCAVSRLAASCKIIFQATGWIKEYEEDFLYRLSHKIELITNLKVSYQYFLLLFNFALLNIGYTDKRPTGTNILMRQRSYRQTY